MQGAEEGQTLLDDLSGLKVAVKTRGELDKYEYQNHTKAVKRYRLIKLTDKSVPFTYEWFKTVHQEMLGDVWQWAGKPRTSDKSIGVPKERIGSEIHALIHDFHQWEQAEDAPAEIVVKLHYRLVYIHPFENGNGRWARLIANIYLRKNGIPFILWPSEPNDVNKNFRPRYLKALKAADQEDFRQLADLHAEYTKNQRRP